VSLLTVTGGGGDGVGGGHEVGGKEIELPMERK
jgi:hypothetical protein